MLSKLNSAFVKKATSGLCQRNSTLLSNSLRMPKRPPMKSVDAVVFHKMYNKLMQTNEKIVELEERFERLAIESENMAVRLDKCVEEQKLFGIQSFSRDFLMVADNINYAKAAVPKDDLAYNPHLKSLFADLCKTQKHLIRTLKRHGVRPVNPIHGKFNPHYHEALLTCSDEMHEPNTVVEVIKCGYKLHQRCLRPALVGVSKVDYI